MIRMFNQKGISLVELMISITIGLILMTGVVQLFLSSRATFSTQQAVARVQESGRLAMEFLASDIRMAGYMGCMSRVAHLVNTLNNADDLRYNYSLALEGADNITATPPAGYPGNILAGTDALVVRSASGNSVGVSDVNSADEVFVDYNNAAVICGQNVTGVSGFCPNDIVVVSDCTKARVFQITGIAAAAGNSHTILTHGTGGGEGALPGNLDAQWGGPTATNIYEFFNEEADTYKLNTTIYYISNSGQSGVPALWRRVNGGNAEELLEGVENMQLSYGRDTNADGVPDGEYQTAAQVTAANGWNQVTSVRVQLLVRSGEDNVLEQPQPYTFNSSVAVTPADRRLRQVFTSTVGIRSSLN